MTTVVSQGHAKFFPTLSRGIAEGTCGDTEDYVWEDKTVTKI